MGMIDEWREKSARKKAQKIIDKKHFDLTIEDLQTGFSNGKFLINYLIEDKTSFPMYEEYLRYLIGTKKYDILIYLLRINAFTLKYDCDTGIPNIMLTDADNDRNLAKNIFSIGRIFNPDKKNNLYFIYFDKFKNMKFSEFKSMVDYLKEHITDAEILENVLKSLPEELTYAFFSTQKNNIILFKESYSFLQRIMDSYFWNSIVSFVTENNLFYNLTGYERFDKKEKLLVLNTCSKCGIDIISFINDCNGKRSDKINLIIRELLKVNKDLVFKIIDLISVNRCKSHTWICEALPIQIKEKVLLPYEELKKLDEPELSLKYDEIFPNGIYEKFESDIEYIKSNIMKYLTGWKNYTPEVLEEDFGKPTEVTFNGKKIKVFNTNGKPFRMNVHAVNAGQVGNIGSSSETIAYLQEKVNKMIRNPEEFTKIETELDNDSISCTLMNEFNMITFNDLIDKAKQSRKNAVLVGFNEDNIDNLFLYISQDGGVSRKDDRRFHDSSVVAAILKKVEKRKKIFRKNGIDDNGNFITYDELVISRYVNGKKRKPDYIVSVYPPEDMEHNEIIYLWAAYYDVPVIYIPYELYEKNLELENLREMKEELISSTATHTETTGFSK